MRFLVIDDDELSRELLALLLGVEGHEVEVAASGEEALARLSAAERPSPKAVLLVILLDMQMPGLSGEPLAAALRAALCGETRLFAMSASYPDEMASGAFDGFLRKPFSIEDLDALLGRTQEKLSHFTEDTESGAVDDAGDPDIPELNEEIYGRMAKMMPAEQLGAMYAMCLADTRERLGQLVGFAKAGADEEYRRGAHTMKGGCGMIGATELYALAEVAEREGLNPKSGQKTGASGVIDLLERFSRACDRLERILGDAGRDNTGTLTGSPRLEK